MNQDHLIGKNLQAIRKKLGFTQDQIAAYLGILREEVSYYENGSRAIPSPLLSQLANLYGVDEFDFFEEDLDVEKIDLAFQFGNVEFNVNDLYIFAKFKKIIRNYLLVKKQLAQ
ncbi:MAG: helix-turn-helix transcriptional regulator [Algoriphagus sp.]|nr:helix-turn-helix transcriptional regulator [Algoriphagus sp.]